MKECPKCKNNDFQVVVSQTSDGKFNEDSKLMVEEDGAEDNLLSVSCAKCGYTFEDLDHGGFGFEWDWE